MQSGKGAECYQIGGWLGNCCLAEWRWNWRQTKRLTPEAVALAARQPSVARRGTSQLGQQGLLDVPAWAGQPVEAAVDGPEEPRGERLVELARGLDDLRFQGVALLSNYGDAYLGEPQFAPLLAELDRRGAVAYVHPTVAGCCQNLVRDLAPAFLELPFDTTRTIASLLYSGTLSKYRRIRWIFAHGGGTLPFLADRLSQWAKARPDLAARLPDGPMAELRRLHFDTASVTNAAAVAAIGQLVPWTQVLFGTDFPYVHSAAQRAELARSLPATRDRAAVEYGNAARLLGI